jgi:hypothetical protein
MTQTLSRWLLASLLVGASLVTAATGHAVELVVNGDFATGDFSGWTVGSGPQVQSTGVGGSHGVFLDQGQDDEFSQTLATVPGQLYRLTFQAAADLSTCTSSVPGSTCNLMVYFGETKVFDETLDSAAFGDYFANQEYLRAEIREVAQTTLTLLRFSYMTDTASIYLDEISVTAVPEIDPATGSSALSLVAGMLAILEQRRRRAAVGA